MKIDTTDLSYQLFEHAYHAGWKRQYGTDIHGLYLDTIREIQVDTEVAGIEDIAYACSIVFGVSVEDMCSCKTRAKKYSLPRSIVYWFAFFFTNIQVSEIGDMIGEKDHSTVLHHANSINELIPISTEDRNRVINVYKFLLSNNKRLLLTSRETQKKPNVPDGMYYTLYLKQQPKIKL